MICVAAFYTAETQGSFANNQGFSVRKPAISFEGTFCINYFSTPAYAPVGGITLYYWNEADYNAVDALTVDTATGTVAMDGTTTWTSGVLGYSIGAYCSSQASKGGDVAGLAMATAVYGYHAKQFFG